MSEHSLKNDFVDVVLHPILDGDENDNDGVLIMLIPDDSVEVAEISNGTILPKLAPGL